MTAAREKRMVTEQSLANGPARAIITLTGTAAPTTTPEFIGQEFIDTTARKVYRAVGTASSSDWVALN